MGLVRRAIAAIAATRPRATRIRSAAASSSPACGSPLLMLQRASRPIVSSKITGTASGSPIGDTAPWTQPVTARISSAPAKWSRRQPSPSAACTALGSTRIAPGTHAIT